MENYFCTRSCGVSWNNKHRQKKNARSSKIERWIGTRIKDTFPTLNVLYNDKSAIGSELDVWIPSLKLAFEIQGITHYEAIFGQEKLEREQRNDEDKRIKCKELDIQLCEINVSDFKQFKGDTQLYKIVDSVLNKIKDVLG